MPASTRSACPWAGCRPFACRIPASSAGRDFLVPTVHRGVTYGLAFPRTVLSRLDPDREAYLTAFMTAREGAILEGKYQQLLPDGNLTSGGSLTHKSLSDSTDSGFRGHFVLDAEIRPDPTTTMGTELNVASHQGYLRRYEYSDSDRLRNRFFSSTTMTRRSSKGRYSPSRATGMASAAGHFPSCSQSLLPAAPAGPAADPRRPVTGQPCARAPPNRRQGRSHPWRGSRMGTPGPPLAHRGPAHRLRQCASRAHLGF